MRPSRRLPVALAFAAVATLLLAWRALASPYFTDYEDEAAPAFDALRAGSAGDFLSALPAYGGSLILRAPFVLAGDALGGGATAAFRLAALPCLLAVIAFGLALFAMQRRSARAWVTLAVVTVNPITMRALEIGHPEELLGSVLCAAAVLAALRDRPAIAGVLLGLAIGNKLWAVLAIGPVLLALDRDRVMALVVSLGVGAVLCLPGVVFAGSTATSPAQVTGAIFQPWQAWWFLGDHGEVVRGLHGGIKEGYRAAPAWLSPIPKPLIVALAVPLCAAFAVRRVDRRDALLLLALLFLLRCLLDPWNTTYYALPAIFALAAWEAAGRRMPVASLAVTALTWCSVELLAPLAAPDLQAAVYLLWAVPAVAAIALRVFAPARARDATAALGRTAAHRLPSLARLLGGGRLSEPSSAPSAGR